VRGWSDSTTLASKVEVRLYAASMMVSKEWEGGGGMNEGDDRGMVREDCMVSYSQ
jgi:hypothetical protein